jgi:hypothetical protein
MEKEKAPKPSPYQVSKSKIRLLQGLGSGLRGLELYSDYFRGYSFIFNRQKDSACPLTPGSHICFQEAAITPNFKDVTCLDIQKCQGYLDESAVHDASFTLLRPSRRLP